MVSSIRRAKSYLYASFWSGKISKNLYTAINIRKAIEQDVKAMLNVAKMLPEWFTSLITDREMPIDFIFHRAIIA